MRVLIILFALLIGAQAAAEPPKGVDGVSFRLYLGDLIRTYGKLWPEHRGRLADHCQAAEEDVSIRYAGSDAYRGAIAQCFGIAELDEGTRLAACEYFIEAAAHYSKAKVAPGETEALVLSLADAKAAIAGLGC
jgi:hypothetical protein